MKRVHFHKLLIQSERHSSLSWSPEFTGVKVKVIQRSDKLVVHSEYPEYVMVKVKVITKVRVIKRPRVLILTRDHRTLTVAVEAKVKVVSGSQSTSRSWSMSQFELEGFKVLLRGALLSKNAKQVEITLNNCEGEPFEMPIRKGMV